MLPRLAAAGPAQHSGGGSLHLRSGRTQGLGLGGLTVPAGSARAAWGADGGTRAWSAPGTVATSFLPSGGGVRLRSRGPQGLLPALAVRPSSAASGSRLASLTSLRSRSKISGKYRPARTIRRAGTGEEHRRGCVSGPDARRVPGLLKGPCCSHLSKERGNRSNPAITSQIYQHLIYLQVSPRPGVTPSGKAT